jgi:hypothetical protein
MCQPSPVERDATGDRSGLIAPFEARLVEDQVWEIRPLVRDVVGHGRTFVEALIDVVDKWPKNPTQCVRPALSRNSRPGDAGSIARGWLLWPLECRGHLCDNDSSPCLAAGVYGVTDEIISLFRVINRDYHDLLIGRPGM